ncbi:MAG TPA: AsmA family protein [Rickettsiales bacterium]|nr:AsmA family protein [Rickettsiales bacterium]
MRKFLKIIAGAVVLLVIGVLALPFVVPVEKLEGPVLAQIEAATGRKVGIGKLSLSVFPNIALAADNVTLSNPAWAGKGNMVEMKALRIGVELMPLLQKQVKVTELTLQSPVIDLIQNGNQANWQFTPAQAPVSKERAQAEKQQDAGMGEIIIPQYIQIKDGNLTFHNKHSGATTKLTGVNLELKAPEPEQKADFDGSLMLNGKKITLSLSMLKPLKLMNGAKSDVDVKLAFGDLKLAWQGTLAFADTVPVLTGKVSIPEIDTGALSGGESGAAPKKSAPSAASSEHWSNDPIDLSGLKSANADLNVTIDKLILKKATLHNIELAVRLAGGKLNVASNAIAAYDGTVKFVLDASSANTAGVAVNIAGVQAEPLMQDFAGSTKVSGKLDLQAQTATQGRSQREMVAALDGKGSFHFSDGKFKGMDLASVIRNVGLAAQDNNSKSTEFSDLTGTFTIAHGVVSNNDLKANSPMLRVSGAGTVDLPGWEVNYLVQPKIVASAQGQGGKDANGITVPVRVEGPLDAPHYRPDVSAAIKANVGNPAAVKDTIKQFKENPGGALQGILR